MNPLIYFSYGMTKSGSTLAYELARAGLVLSGRDQPMLPNDAVLDRKRINFCDHIDADRAAALRRETSKIGHMIAIKTHTRPDPDVVEMLNAGEATAHAVYRDPREMALSMIDHGVKSRAAGRTEFSEYFTPIDTVNELRHQSNSLLAWLSLPNVRPIYYDDLAFNMAPTTRRILGEIGSDVDAQDVIEMAVEQRGTQKNRGKRSRHETEMDADISMLFEEVFAPFYQRLIDNRENLKTNGEPTLCADEALCDWDYDLPNNDRK